MSYKDLSMNGHNPKLDMTEMSINRWKDKQTLVYPYNETLLRQKEA